MRLIYPERSFIEKNTMTSVPSRCLCDVCRCLWSLQLCVGCPVPIRKNMKHALNKSMTFDIATQVLSVYTTFPRFLFPREDHRGKARQVDSTAEVGGKSPALRNCVAFARPWRSRVQMRIGPCRDRPPHRRWRSEPRDERAWSHTPVAQLAYFICILVQYGIIMLHTFVVFLSHNW